MERTVFVLKLTCAFKWENRIDILYLVYMIIGVLIYFNIQLMILRMVCEVSSKTRGSIYSCIPISKHYIALLV